MWINYFKVTLRNLRRHKGFSAINIIGQAVGLVACLLTLAFAWDQARYDDFHAKGDRIVRVLTDQLRARSEVEASFAASPGPLAGAIEREVPGVEQTTRIGQIRTMAIRDGNGVPVEGLFAEPSFFDLFDFRLAEGDPQRSLMLLLSRDMLRAVGLASVVVLPLAWLAGRLLQAFAHRIDVSVGLLAGCAVFMVGLAMGVSATQTVRAARTDPARVLQAE